jgi:hypothetical protein
LTFAIILSLTFNKKDLTVEWCPRTGDMIGDHMTKPNQGALFIKFRDQIMGVTPANDPDPGKAKRDSNSFNNSVVQQGRKPAKLAHRSVLDGELEQTTDKPTDGPCQRTNNRTCPQKTKEQSLDSKKPQQGAKKNTHT